MRQCLRHIVKRATRYPGRIEKPKPVPRRRRRQPGFQYVAKRLGMVGPRRVTAEARIGQQCRQAERGRQRAEQRVIARRDDDVPILTRIGGKGRDAGVPRPQRARRHAGDGVTRHGVFQDGDLPVEHCHIDELALPAPGPVM